MSRTFICNLLCLLLLMLCALPFLAGAQTGTLCNQFTSGSTPPQGYGAAWNVLSSTKELLVSASCETDRAVYTVGSGASNQYVYKTRYAYGTNLQQWNGTTLTGTFAQNSTDWLMGKGTLDGGPIVSNPLYWVGYVCQWTGSVWKCGCRDSACTTNYWQLQASSNPFTSGGSSGGTSGGSSGGASTGGNDINYCASGLLQGGSVKSVTPGTLSSAVSNATAGDVLALDNGTYGSFTITARGTANAPIVIRSRNPGGAVFKDASIQIDGQYIVFACNKLLNGSIEIGDRKDYSATNYQRGLGSRITRNWLNTDRAGGFFVTVGHSSNVRVDHNEFGDSNNNLRRTAVVHMLNNDGGNSRIDHNYFHGSPWIVGSEYEAIWVAGKDYLGAFTKTGISIDHNLFDSWNGDDEVIATKTSGVTIQNNTFLNNKWGPTLRFGEENVVKNNVFDGAELKVRGAKHLIIGNKFVRSTDSIRLLEGTETAAEFRAALQNPPCCGFEQVSDVIVYGNQGGTIEVGGTPFDLPPKGTRLGNNSGTLKLIHHEGTNTNFVWSGTVGAPAGVSPSDVGPNAP